MSPLALMDKIREWKLPVRSHMAELEPDVLEKLRAKLNGGDEPAEAAAAPKKKKAATKKAASSDDAPKAKKVTKKVAAPIPVAANKVAKKSAAAAAAAEAEAPKKGAATTVRKTATKVVVRRKADEEEAAALAAAEKAAQEKEQAEYDAQMRAQAEADMQQEADEAAAEEAAAAAAEAEATASASAAKSALKAEADKAEAATTAATNAANTAAKATADAAASATAEAAATAAADAKTTAATAAAATAAPAAGAPGAAASAPGGAAQVRKREVVMTPGGPSSGIKSEAPRRNIVGRMDLSRVQAPAAGGGPSRPGGPGGGGPGGGFSSGPGGAVGSRPGGGFGGPGGPGGASRPGGPAGAGGFAGPRPLRTGFAAAPAEPEDEATLEARRRFDDKKARTKPGAPGAGGAGSGGKEEEVAQFTATEFRKREMVFQPKKKKGSLNRVAMKTELTEAKASKRVVKVDQTMKLSDLANELGVKAGQLTKVLMQQGVMATMNTVLDFDTIALIAPEFNHEAVNVHQSVEKLISDTAFGDLNAARITRPPVVTIMGHVDHGKTSLLDVIRKANVASGEAGGITQHIGAYQVVTESGHLITFIDTPGHEAFTAMRARGANATDIAIIVVAADDGVMPQTIEAVAHAKAAGVPIIVAVNKMDKAGANPDRVKQQLTEQQLVPEEWGGDTIYAPVSAHTKLGIPELLEQIYTVAEVQELTANPKRSATGIVIESRMDKGRGPVATLLIQDGTLEVGQSIVVGHVAGRVRGLINDKGERVKSAGPSVPVEVQGLATVPLAGDKFDAVENDQAAERIAGERRLAAEAQGPKGKVSLEDIFAKLKQGDLKELNIVLKADMAGSSEAIKGMFEKLGTDEVKPKIIHAAVGGINESDILLASSAKAIVVGFNVRPDSGAQATAKRLNVDVKTYTIVYELVDDMKKAMGGLLAPTITEKQLGRAEVRNTFTVPKAGTIAGSFVTEGKILRNSEVRLLRNGTIVYTGVLSSLKRFKDDAKEVAQGYECGIAIENFNDIKVGDIIEAFVKESTVRELH
ncbi:MAG: translation initiation factor IF-2 [Proteobacteria bacterium]|nr:MAG: translation initiation factor IF-2 [Pseudomonadota bacterium]